MTVRSLALLDEGESGRIIGLHAGWHFRKRMTELGFVKGSEIRMIKKGTPGPCIIEVKGCGRIAIGVGEANKIMIEGD